MRYLFLLASLSVVLGCGSDTTPHSDASVDGEPAVEVVQAETSAGVWDRVQETYESAKESGKTRANSAAEWVGELYEGAATTSQTAAAESAAWINSMYDVAKSTGQTTATNTKDWVMEDLRRMGDWEYRLVRIEADSPHEIEQQLNQLGTERWQCYWIESESNSKTYYLKRQPRSYLRHLPAKEFLRLIPLLSEDGGE